jgi:SAM-dependent methyltransferase
MGDTFDPGSFRDPRGRVQLVEGRVFRWMSRTGWESWSALAASPLAPGWGDGTSSGAGDGRLISTRVCQPGDAPAPAPSGDWVGLLEHECLPWISYPCEWSFGMLRDSALLQLELLRDALPQGLILRDGTAYNIQFRGAIPLLIDLPSLGLRTPAQAWDGYRQFCETTLFPLLLASYRGIDVRPLLRGRLEGISVRECRRLLGWRDLFRGGVVSHVLVQDWLGRASDPSIAPSAGSVPQPVTPADLGPVVAANARKLLRLVESLRAPHRESVWSDYDANRSHYSADDVARKDAFVSSAIAHRRRQLVWDLGCNTGRFSRIAATTADCVVAVDGDPACVERLYQELKAQRNRTILPLVLDLADPTGGLGWRGRERKPFFERGRPDAILALAVIHHLVFRNAVPLSEVTDWLTSTTDELIVEFVGPDDVMVRELKRQRPEHHVDYSWDAFERQLSATHNLMATTTVCEGRRTLVHAVKR